MSTESCGDCTARIIAVGLGLAVLRWWAEGRSDSTVRRLLLSRDRSIQPGFINEILGGIRAWRDSMGDLNRPGFRAKLSKSVLPAPGVYKSAPSGSQFAIHAIASVPSLSGGDTVVRPVSFFVQSLSRVWEVIKDYVNELLWLMGLSPKQWEDAHDPASTLLSLYIYGITGKENGIQEDLP